MRDAPPVCYPRRVRRLATVVSLAISALIGCGSRNVPNRLVVMFDAGSDASADGAIAEPEDAQAEAPSPYLGAPCVDDGQCDDSIPCTYDSCDKAAGRCLNVPDDTQCDDGIYCDGREKCVVGHGCEPGAVVSCSDGNECDIAQCVEATQSCQYRLRDVDQDGDPDGHCAGGHDCNDLDPNVSSLHAEICGNGIDDNCNGQIDESPCVEPEGDSCKGPVVIQGAGTYELTTIGNEVATFATSCSVPTPSAAQNVVAAITVPPGPYMDLDVWATTAGTEVAVALDAMCGEPATELGCGAGQGATSVRARAYTVGPGTYYAVVTTQTPAAVELKVVLLPASSPATNIDCGSATPIQPSVPTSVSIVDPPTLLPSACITSAASTAGAGDAGTGGAAGVPHTGELTYALTLTQTQDIRIYASTLQGSGSPIIGLRDPACTGAADELTCRTSASLPVFERALPPGVYVVTVAATSPIDASIQVVLSAPSATPLDQTCASPPAVAPNGSVTFDLANHESAIADMCAAGEYDAAYDISLAVASDVLLVERLGETDMGAVSLDPPACTAALACTQGATPVRIGKRNVAAGDYRAVVADVLGLEGTLDALVRPTVAPTILAAGAADTCAAPVDVSAGGFFTGDTSTASADFDNPCDTPTSPPGGAPDQVLSLNLAQPQRVVLDSEGSSYTTILDVRQGSTCPGLPVDNACYVGFTAQKSFLDLELEAGQYWVIVDGYSGASGPWNLDVRVLPP